MLDLKFTGIKGKPLKLIILIIVLLLIAFLFIFFVLNPRGKSNELENALENLPPSDFLTEEERVDLVAAEELKAVLDNAIAPVAGADLISKEGKVINSTGVVVRSDVSYDSPEAPKQTLAISEDNLDSSVIKLKIGADGFSPNEFRVKKGQAVTLSLSGNDDSAHVLAFKDPRLSAVYLNINQGETRAVVFSAPDEAGSYFFHCDFPGHRSRGEEGVMIVN